VDKEGGRTELHGGGAVFTVQKQKDEAKGTKKTRKGTAAAAGEHEEQEEAGEAQF